VNGGSLNDRCRADYQPEIVTSTRPPISARLNLRVGRGARGNPRRRAIYIPARIKFRNDIGIGHAPAGFAVHA
jgi:hypothetical protein